MYFGPHAKIDLRFWAPLVGLILLAAALRLYRLDGYPQNFNQDELLSGYEGLSIWTTGADQHGEILPIHFRDYNEYSPGLTFYIEAPFVGLFGLNEFTTRLPVACLGIATVFLAALIGRRWFGPEAGLLAALFLSFDPWSLNYSRLAFGPSHVPFFITATIYTILRFVDSLKSSEKLRPSGYFWLTLSALCSALMLYVYSTLKVEGPLLVMACALAALPLLLKRRGAALLWVGLYILFAVPIAFDQVTRWTTLQWHFGQLTLLGQPNWFFTFLSAYANAFNPGYLLFESGSNLVVHPVGIGLLFWLEPPLWVAALVGLAQDSKLSQKAGLHLPTLIGLWFATYPLAASLTGTVSDMRSTNLLPLPELLAGYGAVVVLRKLSQTRLGWRLALYGAVVPGIIILIIFNTFYLSYFFSVPLLSTGISAEYVPYNVGLRPVLEYISHTARACDQIWLEPAPEQTYMYYLFFTRYAPARFQQATSLKTTLPGGWLDIPWFDNVRIGVPGLTEVNAPAPAGCQGKPSRTYFAARLAETGPDWQEALAVKNAADEPIWRALILKQDYTF